MTDMPTFVFLFFYSVGESSVMKIDININNNENRSKCSLGVDRAVGDDHHPEGMNRDAVVG